MKIISGKFKNRNIYMPAGSRPIQHVARKALFDTIGQDMEGVAFLDLFAGSGSVGLEAISRGAPQCVFVENNEACMQVIRENLALLHLDNTSGLHGPYPVLGIDGFAAIKYLVKIKKKFDVVFADPPYGREMAKKALKLLNAYDIFNPAFIVIIKHGIREILPEASGRFLAFRARKFGSSCLTFYQDSNK